MSAAVTRVIDCDVHAQIASIETLDEWLDPHWREVARTTQFRGPTDTPYPPSAATSQRPDLAAVEGVAETLGDLQAHAFGPWDVEFAILSPTYSTEAVKNPDAASALARAVNSWTAARWLTDPRIRGSLVVPGLYPQLAADEIDYWAGNPAFVQVLLSVRSFAPYGNRVWAPLLEAITRAGLVLNLHFGGATGDPPTSIGWPSTYVEEYVDMPNAFQTQIMSLVAEGAFSRHPDLRVLCSESGFAWMPSFMWRFDRLWHGLRREIPWVEEPPSAYVRRHVRLTTQPFDAPRSEFGRVLDHIGSDQMLCFASDYPHWQFDDPADALPPLEAGPARDAILAGNARRLYGLGGDEDGA